MTAPRAPIDAGVVDAESPWPGLASFRETDRALFFGREGETEELFRLILRERLTVLFGLSGLGKTSLLQAGVFPRLREENVLPVSVRLDHSVGAPPFTAQILAALARACEAAGAEMPPARPGETLWEFFHRQGNEFWNARNRPVVPLLAFDQFEEIFTLGAGRPGSPEVGGLIATLASLAEGHPPASVKARLDEAPADAKQFSFGRHSYKLLLSLREDFLPDLEALRDRIRTIGTNRMRIRRMTGENALRVVLLPGRGLVEPDVAERTVRFVAGEEPGEEPAPLAALDIEPALLSIVCRELNNKRLARGEARITADLLEGSRTEILTGLYERSLEGLAPEVRTFIEEKLLTVSGFRDSEALENALATPGISREAIDRLTEWRLLRIEDHDGGQRLELTHDVLTGVVRQSRDRRRQGEAQERAEAARRQAEERERKVRRELRRSRRMLLLVAVLLLGVAVFSALAYLGDLKVKRTLAATDVLRAFILEGDRPQEALACLGHALRLDPGSLAARSLLFDLLLHRSWLLPVRSASSADAESVALDRNDRTAAVVNDMGDVRLLDLATLRPTGVKLDDPDPVATVRYTDDGRRIATFTESTVRLWDVDTGRLVGGPFPLENTEIQGLGPDWRRVMAIRNRTARFLDAASGREAGPPVPETSLRSWESYDGEHILLLDGQGALVVHDIPSGRTVGPPMTADGEIRIAMASPDGRLICALLPKSVKVWDGITHAPLAEIQHEADVTYGRLVAGGRLLITHADDGFVRIWDARTGALRGRIELDAAWRSFEVSPDGRVLLTVTEDRTARLWDVATGRLLAEPVQDVASANLLTDGAGVRLSTASEDGLVRLLAPTVPAKTTLVAAASDSGFEAFDISPDGRLFAAAEAGALTVWDTATGLPVGRRLPSPLTVAKLHFVAGGRQVAVVWKSRPDANGEVQTKEALAWDFRTGRITGPVTLREWPYFATVSPDGSRVTVVESSEAPDVFRVLDLAGGKALTGPLPYRAKVWGPVPFSPDGGRLLAAPKERVVEVVDAGNGRVLATLTHRALVLKADFSPDGRQVVTVADDRTARLWDAASGRLLRSFTLPHGLVSAVLADHGRRLLTLAEDIRVRIWDTATGEPLGEPLLTPAASAVAMSPDGRRVVVLSAEAARLWDPDTSRTLGNAMAPGGASLVARFTSGGHALLLAGDRALGRWELPGGAEGDGKLLVRWAETAGGYRLDGKGAGQLLPDLPAHLRTLRENTAGAPFGSDTAASLIRWFLAEPGQRPARPLPP